MCVTVAQHTQTNPVISSSGAQTDWKREKAAETKGEKTVISVCDYQEFV